jgi:hypothetical protein
LGVLRHVAAPAAAVTRWRDMPPPLLLHPRLLRVEVDLLPLLGDLLPLLADLLPLLRDLLLLRVNDPRAQGEMTLPLFPLLLQIGFDS